MGDGDDDNDGDDAEGREGPPSVSRLSRGDARRFRVLSRASDRSRTRNRYPRQRRQIPVAELIGNLIKHHGLTDEVRQRFVCLYWPEIAGERIGSKTFPVSFSKGVLCVSGTSSSWVQELRFLKARLIAQVNHWIDANRVWLGPPPLVTDMRFVLGMQRWEPLVEPEHARRLRLRHLRRLMRPDVMPPSVSDADREAIRIETSEIADAELRAVIESVRMKWNR